MKKYVLLSILSFSSALLFATVSFAEIYKWVDAKGKTHFGDDKEAQTAVKAEAPVVVELKEANAYTETKPTAAELERRSIELEQKSRELEQQSAESDPDTKDKSEQPVEKNRRGKDR